MLRGFIVLAALLGGLLLSAPAEAQCGSQALACYTLPIPAVSGGTSVFSEIVAANTTSVAVKGTPGQIYGMRVFSNNTTPVYGKLYDVLQSGVTCGSGTPKDRFEIPAQTGGSGFVVPVPFGMQFTVAITLCVTGGIADADTTNPAATSYLVSIDFK